MTESLERQFNDGLEILETIKTPGYKLLEEMIQREITRTQREIDRMNVEAVENAETTNAQQYLQGIIKLQSRKDGLQYIINQSKILIEKKDKANKKLS